MLQSLWHKFTSTRLWALMQKEVRQILRDRQLLFLLVFPPTVQLIVFGYALSPEVQNLRLAVRDLSNSPISRELIAAVVENHVFDLQPAGRDYESVPTLVRNGNVEAGMIIPPEFNREIKHGKTTHVQILLDGVDANTAGIAAGYLAQIFNAFNQQVIGGVRHVPVKVDATYLYNPGLIAAWFFVPGVMGLVLNLTGSLVSSSALVREKDEGTLEQLLMTPAYSWEILGAKIIPLYFLLLLDSFLSLSVGMLIFRVPFRGNLFLYLGITSLYILVAISIGIVLATISKNQRQAILTSFFINLPVINLSGAVAPIASMPIFFQYLSLFNPLRYYVTCVRSVLLKGVGLDVLWPNVIVLALFAVILLSGSAYKFRTQLN